MSPIYARAHAHTYIHMIDIIYVSYIYIQIYTYMDHIHTPIQRDPDHFETPDKDHFETQTDKDHFETQTPRIRIILKHIQDTAV